ncbi:unnamed protein product [Caenorhabditis sp. 36 PRJEB53466]|nr:unnamed protein product [Caenorhabditis sp. 36 PRJEB53466]
MNVKMRMSYLLTLLLFAILTAACFFILAADVLLFLARLDVQHAKFYVYGGVLYLAFSLILILHVSRCVVEDTYDTFHDIIQGAEDERNFVETV